MRARLALRVSGAPLELREIVLKHKPASMLEISPKATVPVLQLASGEVLDESIDIMHWALGQADPEAWLQGWNSEAEALVLENDQVFKRHLDMYKYADRHPDEAEEVYRGRGEDFLQDLERRLQLSSAALEPSLDGSTAYLFGTQPTLADMAIFPFVRQFAHVDKTWFYASRYSALIGWLDALLASDVFVSIMPKLKPWQLGDPQLLFHCPPQS